MADLQNNISIEKANDLFLENNQSFVKQAWVWNQARPENNTQVNTIGDYAANLPSTGISEYTLLFVLMNWTNAVNNNLLPAIATDLAAVSQLQAQISEEMNNKLENDNNEITYYSTGQGSTDKNASNYVTQWQSQFNTDQSYYSVGQTNYQGVIQALSQQMQQQGSAESNIITMMSQILQSFVLVS